MNKHFKGCKMTKLKLNEIREGVAKPSLICTQRC